MRERDLQETRGSASKATDNRNIRRKLRSSFPDGHQPIAEVLVDAVPPLLIGERGIARAAVLRQPLYLLPPNDFFAFCGSTFEH